MKKFTAIALCIVLTVAAMAGCRGKNPEETAGPTLMPTETSETTQPATNATMPTILPSAPTDDTGTTDNATGGTNEGTPRGRMPMPIQ